MPDTTPFAEQIAALQAEIDGRGAPVKTLTPYQQRVLDALRRPVKRPAELPPVEQEIGYYSESNRACLQWFDPEMGAVRAATVRVLAASGHIQEARRKSDSFGEEIVFYRLACGAEVP